MRFITPVTETSPWLAFHSSEEAVETTSKTRLTRATTLQIFLRRWGFMVTALKSNETQWARGVGVFIKSTNILLNLARFKSIWISTSRSPSCGLSFSVQVSVFP